MWRWLRWLYLTGMVLLPVGMWWGLRTLGMSLRETATPGDVPLSGIVFPWWIGWEMAALAALLEWRKRPAPPDVPWRQEVGLWLLYSAMGALIGAVFALWIWLTVSTTNWLARLWPPAEGFAPLIGLLWLGGIIGGMLALASRGVTDEFRRAVRRILGQETAGQDILRLLEQAPIPKELKAQYARRIRAEGMSRAVAEALLEALSEAPPGETVRERRDALLLEQALMDWLGSAPEA